MRFKSLLLAAPAALVLSTTAVLADDPDGYYSRADHEGYYDHDGHYRHMDAADDRAAPDDRPRPPIGHRYEWEHDGNRGYFVATREFNDGGDRCREFTTVTYRHGEELRRDGVACYDNGEWRTRDG